MDGWREGRSDERRVCFEFCQELREGPDAPPTSFAVREGLSEKNRFSSATAAQLLDVSSGLWLNPAPTS